MVVYIVPNTNQSIVNLSKHNWESWVWWSRWGGTNFLKWKIEKTYTKLIVFPRLI